MKQQSLPPPQPSLPTLPFEIIAEILTRLPVKLLIQLKCVCKSWNSLISDCNFVKKHLQISTLNPKLIIIKMEHSRFSLSPMVYPLRSFFTAVTTDGTKINYPVNSENNFVRIVGSCNGILCLSHGRFPVVWNPSIGKHKILPSFEIPNQAVWANQWGFGYDNLTDNYKVVGGFSYGWIHNIVFKTQLNVLTVGTDSWRLIKEFPYYVSFSGSGKFVSGTINWMVSTGLSPSMKVLSKNIVSVDLRTESYQEISQPDYGEGVKALLGLDVLKDCLCFLCSRVDKFTDIWLMKEYGNRESWTRLFTVPTMGVHKSFTYVRALSVFDDDRVILEFLEKNKSKLAVYDSSNGTFKLQDNKKFTHLMLQKEIYVESLISPCY